MRTIAQETAFQIVLRNCSKEVGWEVSEGGVCAIKPMFFLQKVDRGIYSSVIELLLFTRLMAYYQNIFSVFLWKNKLCRHLWFAVTPHVTFSSPQFTNFVDQQNVGWEEYELLFFHMKASDQLHPHVQMLILKMLFFSPCLDLKNQKFWEGVPAFWAGLSEDVELWAEPRSTESLGNEASALLDGEGFHYV